MSDRIAAITNKIAEMKKELADEGKKVLNEEFKAFFAANPEIKIVAWTQYTPHFNDGDPCHFSVHDFNFGTGNRSDYSRPYDIEEHPYYGGDEHIDNLANGVTDEEDEDKPLYSIQTSSYMVEKYVKTEEGRALSAAAAKFTNLLTTIPDDVYEDLFGDGVAVWATAEGFEVDEYDHD